MGPRGMFTASNQTCSGYGAVAPTQRISLSNSAAAADPGHHHRREEPNILTESGRCRIGFLGRQQSGVHDDAAKAFKSQPEEIEAWRGRVDQPGTPLTAKFGEAGGFHIADHAAPVVTFESGLGHEAKDHFGAIAESRVLALESEATPVVVDATDLEAFPAGADAEFLEQCAPAGIPQRLHAGKPCPLLGEALVEDVVAGHD